MQKFWFWGPVKPVARRTEMQPPICEPSINESRLPSNTSGEAFLSCFTQVARRSWCYRREILALQAFMDHLGPAQIRFADWTLDILLANGASPSLAFQRLDSRILKH
jgi:hypothetical protein